MMSFLSEHQALQRTFINIRELRSKQKVKEIISLKYNKDRVDNVKIAYIGGGSRGWAWGLMSDLVSCDDISGSVYLYDIDFDAAQHN